MNNLLGNFCLRIVGDCLDFEEITRNLNLEPTHVVKKGVIYRKIVGEALHDSWIYNIEFNKNDNPRRVLSRLIDTLKPSRDYLVLLSELVDIGIRCYLSSDYAQIYIRFDPKIIQEIAEMKLYLEISILSFGGIEDED